MSDFQEQEIVVNPIGLITQPNVFGRYPVGALKRATGVVIRDPGIVRTHGSFTSLASTPWTAGTVDAVHIVPSTSEIPYSLILYHTTGGDWRSYWANPDGTAATIANTLRILCYVSTASFITTTLSDPELFVYSHTVSRNRVVLALRDSVMVCDAPTGSTPSAPRVAGLRPPRFNVNLTNVGSGTAIGTGKHANVVAVHRRVYSDGYVLESAPGPVGEIDSGGAGTGPHDFTAFFGDDSETGFLIGDHLDIYRTRTQAAGAAAVNVGAEYRLCASYTLRTSGAPQSIISTASDESLGASLYTNPGQKGSAGANTQPWPAKCVATFKGYTFYGAVTEPPSVPIRAALAWTALNNYTPQTAAARQNSYGTFTVTGTATSGSPTLTGVTGVNIFGPVIGQYSFFAGRFPAGAKVVSVGGSSVTLNSNATSSGAETIFLNDIVELNAAECVAGDWYAFRTSLRDEYSVSSLELVVPPSAIGTSTGSALYCQPAEAVLITYPFLANLAARKSISFRATRGHNLVPFFPRIESSETAETVSTLFRPNSLKWSEEQQPEHVPTANQAFVGRGEILGMVPTRDALWIFCTDGLWRLSGTGGGAGTPGFDWRVDPVDPTLILQSRRAWCVLRDVVYALTNRGLVSIDSSGKVEDISQGRIGDFLPGQPFSDAFTSTWMYADEVNDEVIINDASVSRLASNPLIYNALTDTFTQMRTPTEALAGQRWLHGAFSRGQQRALLIPSSSNNLFRVDESASNQLVTIEYQPAYGKDPFMLRRWQRIRYALGTLDGSSSQVFPLVNGSSGPFLGMNVLPLTGTDAVMIPRESCPVPRNSPAISNCISVGLESYYTNMPPFALYGISIESVPFTRQRKARNR